MRVYIKRSIFAALLIAALFVTYCYVFASTPTYLSTNKKALYLAHRGYSGVYPEGTKIAFLKAIESNADGLEFDVRQTKDGEIVISHDDNLNGISGIDIEIDKSTLSQLQAIPLYHGQRILTLREVINLAKSHGNIFIWPEIKDSQKYPNIINNIIKILQAEDYVSHTIIQSFKTQDLTDIHSIDKNIQLFQLTMLASDSELSNLPDFIRYIGAPIALAYARPGLIEKVHAAKKKIILWRESSLFENKHVVDYLTELGTDGFMINYPTQILE